mmetsp:Transcript_45537/g.106503  ORF Transcript_45537/g.106503 Transcript_45537/m.106503 type:complete len:223 (-) Transcript_45537:939-1607(-)
MDRHGLRRSCPSAVRPHRSVLRVADFDSARSGGLEWHHVDSQSHADRSTTGDWPVPASASAQSSRWLTVAPGQHGRDPHRLGSSRADLSQRCPLPATTCSPLLAFSRCARPRGYGAAEGFRRQSTDCMGFKLLSMPCWRSLSGATIRGTCPRSLPHSPACGRSRLPAHSFRSAKVGRGWLEDCGNLQRRSRRLATAFTQLGAATNPFCCGKQPANRGRLEVG